MGQPLPWRCKGEPGPSIHLRTRQVRMVGVAITPRERIAAILGEPRKCISEQAEWWLAPIS
jgi:hypothetical protein